MQIPYTEGDLIMVEEKNGNNYFNTKIINWGMAIIASLTVVFCLAWVTWVSVLVIQNKQENAVLNTLVTQKLDSLEKQLQQNNNLMEQIKTNQIQDHYILREHMIETNKKQKP